MFMIQRLTQLESSIESSPRSINHPTVPFLKLTAKKKPWRWMVWIVYDDPVGKLHFQVRPISFRDCDHPKTWSTYVWGKFNSRLFQPSSPPKWCGWTVGFHPPPHVRLKNIRFRNCRKNTQIFWTSLSSSIHLVTINSLSKLNDHQVHEYH